MTVGRFVVAVLVGLALIDIAGPQITRRSPPAIAWLWMAIALTLIVWLALMLWHRRRVAELRRHWALSEDWEKVPPWTRDDFWACPRCGTICPSISWVQQHLDPLTSPCAALREHIDQLTPEVKEKVPGAGWPAVIPDNESAGDEET